ncbi:MAG: biopolymer transporter ExbD [Candidatus Brocadiales bacterium]|nr:biopolymer transporter ExbD [Candidatus Bathyanammoxibius amoris]
MDFRTRRAVNYSINIASLIDVLFLLLMFFVVTSVFIEQPNIKLELPSASHAETTKFEGLTITINKEGRLFFGKQPVGITELDAILRSKTEALGDIVLVLRADRDVAYGVVIAVMDVARGAGLKRITALTVSEEETR